MNPSASPSRRLFPLLIGLLVLLAMNLVAWAYIRHEQYIYYWDYSNYWMKTRGYVALLREQPFEALRQLFHSVRYNNYNDLAAFGLAPLALVAGTSRLAYTLLVTNTYLAGAVAAAWACARAISGPDDGLRRRAGLAGLGLALLSTALWQPVLRGFPDVGGAALGLLLLGHLALRPPAARTVVESLLVGLALAGMFLFRRYFSLWVEAYAGTALLVYALPPLLRARGKPGPAWLGTRSLALTGVALLLALLVAAKPILLSMITLAGSGEVADRFTIYKAIFGVAGNARNILAFYGWPLALLACAGAALGLASPRSRPFAWFVVVHFLLTCVIVTRFHQFVMHQFYMLTPCVFAAAFLAIDAAARRWSAPAFRRAALAGGLLLSVNALAVLHPGFTRFAPVFLATPCTPQVRHDLPELQGLAHFLAERGRRLPEARSYLLCSSSRISDEIILNACATRPEFPSVIPGLLRTAHLDWDNIGFPELLLSADLLVVANPLQYHIAPINQQVIQVPAEQLLSATGWGSAYRPLEQRFHLERGIEVLLFERIRPLTEADRRHLQEAYSRTAPANAARLHESRWGLGMPTTTPRAQP